ncbi:S-layer homology domain-containing protein [Paenibacillus sp. JX-17]|uniref:S-layer homology domain-containing protein n=1 Tax=Paenibacillus lacisoli TaxID=3064525 RepID=A0ABT9CEQ5_9BACL|nr:S-layer homology domain-containing protein [Paenibacillus sp. JX-17]MDO7907696.1 S-layer homology domain-containing protein [Paenibacillus sp. JX-17]
MRSKPNKWLIALAVASLAAPTTLQTLALADSSTATGTSLAALPFKDISKMAPEQKSSILQALEAGLLSGDPSGSYRPTDLLTRQEMAVLLTQALRLPVSKTGRSNFSDVDQRSWSSPYIEAVHRAGLMNGDGSSKFRPKAAVTREEAAVLLMRAAGLPVTADATESSKLTDWNQVSPWARPYVNTAVQSGSMVVDQARFNPKAFVQRQDIAQYMMSTFFPKDHSAQLQKIEKGKAWINGVEYELSDAVQGVLQAANQQILNGADIQFTASKRTIESITKLVIHASGHAPTAEAPEFSGNLVLDGHGSTINGDLIIDGDYISVNNLIVTDRFTITPSLENDFYASKLTVRGKSNIQGGDQNTVMFISSKLDDVDVSKPDVHVVTKESSTIGQMTLTSNATIENDSTSALPKLNLLTGAQQVELKGTVQQLTVNANQPLSLTGQASINTMVVNSSSPVSLGVTGTVTNLQVNNPAANINVSSASQITNTSFAPGVSSSTVTGGMSVSGVTAGSTGGSSAPVVAANTAPVLTSKYNDQAITVGDSDLEVDLLGHFTDAEQSVLKYTAVSSSSGICSVRVEGTKLIIKAIGRGTATITIAADDQAGKKAGTNFKVRVNESPVSSGIPDQSKQLGSGDISLSLGTMFTDSDGDPLTYEVTVDDPSIATFSLVDDQLVLTPASTGSTRFHVKASDGRGGSTSQMFKLEVTALPNQNPAVHQKPGNPMLTLGAADYNLDLSSVFSDPDSDPVTITAVSSDLTVAEVSVIGNQATVHGVSRGTANIQLKAADGRGGEVTTDFDVTVNAPPVSQGVPDQTQEMNSGNIQLSLNQFFNDPDGDPLTYRVSGMTDPAIATAALVGDMLTLTPLKTGSTSVSIKAEDGRGGEIVDTFQATITAAAPQNQAPVEIQPADQSLVVGDPAFSLDLGPVFTDPDGDTLTYEASSSDGSVASVGIVGAQLTIQAFSAGTASIHVTAKDGRGGEASTAFQVNVEPAVPSNPSTNQPPEVVASIYEQVLTAGVTNPRSYDLSQLFNDADGDALTFTSKVASGSMVNAEVNGSTLTLTPGTQGGTTKVMITADDGNGGKVSYELQVTNAPLAANGFVQIRTKQGVKDPITYEMLSLFPGETSFKVYSGTPDSTFTGPSILNGTVWNWNGDLSQYYWVIGANGTAAVFQVTSIPQGQEELYFSQYVSLDKTRNALQMYFNPVGDTSQPITNAGYSLEIHQYNLSTNTPKVWSQPINTFWKGMPVIYIDSTFYDFFDITNATYYNDEMPLMQTNTNVTTGFVLKKNGLTIDVLGDPDGKTQFMPNGGTIIRKSGIRSGSSSYSLSGEWNSFPAGTLQYISQHNP